MKQTTDDEGREMNLLEKGVKIDDIVNAFNNKEMPLTILPKGLTQTRAQYLYDKYVHCAYKICPKPNPSEQSNTDNPTVNITEREEFDVPGPPTHNSNTIKHV